MLLPFFFLAFVANSFTNACPDAILKHFESLQLSHCGLKSLHNETGVIPFINTLPPSAEVGAPYSLPPIHTCLLPSTHPHPHPSHTIIYDARFVGPEIIVLDYLRVETPRVEFRLAGTYNLELYASWSYPPYHELTFSPNTSSYHRGMNFKKYNASCDWEASVPVLRGGSSVVVVPGSPAPSTLPSSSSLSSLPSSLPSFPLLSESKSKDMDAPLQKKPLCTDPSRTEGRWRPLSPNVTSCADLIPGDLCLGDPFILSDPNGFNHVLVYAPDACTLDLRPASLQTCLQRIALRKLRFIGDSLVRNLHDAVLELFGGDSSSSNSTSSSIDSEESAPQNHTLQNQTHEVIGSKAFFNYTAVVYRSPAHWGFLLRSFAAAASCPHGRSVSSASSSSSSSSTSSKKGDIFITNFGMTHYLFKGNEAVNALLEIISAYQRIPAPCRPEVVYMTTVPIGGRKRDSLNHLRMDTIGRALTTLVRANTDWKVLDIGPVTRGRWDASYDGLHYVTFCKTPSQQHAAALRDQNALSSLSHQQHVEQNHGHDSLHSRSDVVTLNVTRHRVCGEGGGGGGGGLRRCRYCGGVGLAWAFYLFAALPC
jgi:hypothetical protein